MKSVDSSHVSPIFRWILVLAVVITPLVIVPHVVQAQQNWKAIVGAESKDEGTQAMAFLPNEPWIFKGDSITWTSLTHAIHTVTFLMITSV